MAATLMTTKQRMMLQAVSQHLDGDTQAGFLDCVENMLQGAYTEGRRDGLNEANAIWKHIMKE